MKVTTIKFMKRKNLGNYEHEELSMEAILSEDESAAAATVRLMFLVNSALNGEVGEELTTTEVVKMELKPLGIGPVATANIVKEKAAPRSRAKAAAKDDTLDNGQAIPPVIEQEAATSENTGATSQVVGRVDRSNVAVIQSEKPVAKTSVDKNVVAYDATVKEHRSRFATYLGTNFPKWKTCQPEEAIRTFSKNLHGKPFEDTKGNMLPEFKAELETFFVNGK